MLTSKYFHNFSCIRREAQEVSLLSNIIITILETASNLSELIVINFTGVKIKRTFKIIIRKVYYACYIAKMRNITGMIFGRATVRHLEHQEQSQHLLSFILKSRTVDLSVKIAGSH